MRETEKRRISSYSMKMQLYPSSEQKQKIDNIFRALHLAYNMTFHEVFEKNPNVCTKPNSSGATWPDYKKMAKPVWRNYLISKNPIVKEAPSVSLSNASGLFHLDAQRAWKTGMHNIPIEASNRKDFNFYNAERPRRSFFMQLTANQLQPSSENKKVAWITLSKKIGKVKARGFNNKLWFGHKGDLTYAEARSQKIWKERLSARISKDTCGDYYISITFFEGEKKERPLFLEAPIAEKPTSIGIDVGIKDIAILSTGQKIENKHFKKEKASTLAKLNHQLSKRWGPANMAYRDYNKARRNDIQNNINATTLPLAPPSKRYLATKHKKTLIERKIARRRDTYYHQQTANIIRQSNMIALETLRVSNMLRNHKLASALSDAAMSNFMEKLAYKAERSGIEIRRIGIFEATSQLCSNCGEQYPAAKNLSVREWTCPTCKTHHDRDINAAKNILSIALQNQTTTDPPLHDNENKKQKTTLPKARKSKDILIFPDRPDIVVVFSKDLTSFRNPRYIIKNKKTNIILDDAQGVGYKSASNAKNSYKAKIKYAINQNP